MQNKIIWSISNLKEQVESKTSASFSRCDVLNVGQICDYQVSIFVFQSMKHICPEYFHDYFSMNQEHHNYDTKNSQLLSHEQRKTVRSSYVAHNLGPSVWNNLPAGIRESVTLYGFKNKLKTFYLSNRFWRTWGFLCLFLQFLGVRCGLNTGK